MHEKDLYEPILDWIKVGFRQRFRWRENSNFSAVDVAELEWLPPAGKWMHPDLAFVHVHRRTFDPTPTLDLHTFEVKIDTADLLQSLHQTLAHGRIADFTHLIAPTTARWTDEVVAQAVRFGVGLIAFQDVRVHSSYEVRNDAQRSRPDADLRNQFLDAALTRAGEKADVLRWLRGLGD